MRLDCTTLSYLCMTTKFALFLATLCAPFQSACTQQFAPITLRSALSDYPALLPPSVVLGRFLICSARTSSLKGAQIHAKGVEQVEPLSFRIVNSSHTSSPSPELALSGPASCHHSVPRQLEARKMRALTREKRANL